MASFLSVFNGFVWVAMMICVVVCEVVCSIAWSKIHEEGRVVKAIVRVIADAVCTLLAMTLVYALFGSLFGGIFTLVMLVGYSVHRVKEALAYDTYVRQVENTAAALIVDYYARRDAS